MRNYHGYVFARPFNGLNIPVPAQNSCLREYVARREALYTLPPLESYFANCYHQLFGLIDLLEHSDSILMYSLLMLPFRTDPDMYADIVSKSNKKNIVYAFALENIEGELDSLEVLDAIDSYRFSTLKSQLIEVQRYF